MHRTSLGRPQRLDEITATDIEAFLRTLIATAVRRRNHCASRNTGESLIAARRGGILGLHIADLDTELCAVFLREKGGTVRRQPITPTITRALVEHATCRGTMRPTDGLLRYRDVQPLTSWRPTPCPAVSPVPPKGRMQ